MLHPFIEKLTETARSVNRSTATLANRRRVSRCQPSETSTSNADLVAHTLSVHSSVMQSTSSIRTGALEGNTSLMCYPQIKPNQCEVYTLYFRGCHSSESWFPDVSGSIGMHEQIGTFPPPVTACIHPAAPMTTEHSLLSGGWMECDSTQKKDRGQIRRRVYRGAFQSVQRIPLLSLSSQVIYELLA